MGYTASAIGRGLVSGRTEAVGVVVTSISDPFNGEVVEGIEDAANEHGLSVILATSQGLPERELSVVRAFQSRRVDGIIVASSRVGSNYSGILADLQIPVVLLNNQHPDAFSYSVSIDNTQGAFQATSHLLALGHRRIAYLGDRLGLHSDSERRLGFLKAMESAGETIQPHYLLDGDGKMAGAQEAFFKMLDSGREIPTALFCYNDVSAVGVMQAARARHISIPDQLSIVGFDDIQVAALVSPELTTIRQPKKELGTRSMRLLMQLLGGKEEVQKSVVLTGELIVRGSTSNPGRLIYQSISAGKNSATRSS